MENEYLKIINFIADNPELVIQEPEEYANQLTFAFSQKFYPEKVNPVLFPKMRLHVERMTHEFIEANFLPLSHLAKMLPESDNNNFTEVWITTSNIYSQGLLIVQISFE